VASSTALIYWVFRESSGWFWGVIVAATCMDAGFSRPGVAAGNEMMRDGGVEQGTAAAGGWIFVRGFSRASIGARGVR
jgi:hypothetical protein